MGDPKRSPVALIMAGGSGTRFWPLSQKNLPKQYLKLSGNRSLIQQTVDRIRLFCDFKDIYISSHANQRTLLNEHVPEISGLILEPLPRNTAACLMLSVAALLKKGYSLDTPMMVFPSDHEIGNSEQFIRLLKQALTFATENEALITLGICPTSPHTGYGYIEAGTEITSSGIYQVRRFTEKPDIKTAEKFIQQNSYFWNSGIFIWTLGSISKAFETFLADAWKRIFECSSETGLKDIFTHLPSLPIDTAILEKASNVYVIPAGDLKWSDLGSWNALHELRAKSPDDNLFLQGQIKQIDSQGCLVQVSPETKVALVGLKNLIIVEHNGTLLITERSQDQKVKDISQHFEA